MKLLILTQKVDQEDQVLGFFHNWLIHFASQFEKISVICLQKGQVDLPANVTVFSLGKERGQSRLKYVFNFFNLILGLHREYEAVFVHMNQEYVLLGGLCWRVMKKKVFLWRNHPIGGLLTTLAVALANRVFCTSSAAFVKRYKKTELMPVGIDTNKFSVSNLEFTNRGNKILFLSRIAPIKQPDLLVEALAVLSDRGVDFQCDFYGEPLPKDQYFYEALKKRTKELGLDKKVNFYKGVPNYETPKIYKEYGIFVNLSPAGSFDKTILESAACGELILTTNDSLRGEIDEIFLVGYEKTEIAARLEYFINLSSAERSSLSNSLVKYVKEKHSLEFLTRKLKKEIKNV